MTLEIPSAAGQSVQHIAFQSNAKRHPFGSGIPGLGGNPPRPGVRPATLAGAGSVIAVPVSVMIMRWIFSVRFAISPLDVARQVFFAQLLPLGIGAALHPWRPVMAARFEHCASTSYGSHLYDGAGTWNGGAYRCVSL